ncbi:MAG: branched-chain amino acid ABC transporter permease [Candidatus Bathyarchaeia archaeon]
MSAFAIASAIVFPHLNPTDFGLRLMIMIFVYSTLAESWNIIGGYTGYFSFGQTTFFGIGAYTAAILLRDYDLSPFLTAPLGGVLAMAVAIGVGMITLRLRGAYFTISTYVIMLTATVLANNLIWLTGGGRGMALAIPTIPIHLFLVIIYYVMLALLLLNIFVVNRIVNSNFGLGLASIRENEGAAEVMGVNTVRYKAYAYAISAFFPAVVGAVWAYDMSYIYPITVFDMGIEILVIVMVIFGSACTIAGPLIGGVVLILLREMLRFTLVESGPLYLIIFGMLLVVVVIFMPEGVVKRLARKRG